ECPSRVLPRDEWSYWTERHPLLAAHDFAEFFLRPHFGHWTALIMAVWLPLDRLFGLKTYLPYGIPTIGVHCLAGTVLFGLLCELRFRPVVATAAAGVYLFLGSAAGNVSFGWQVCFVAPIALCYLSLLAGLRTRTTDAPRWLR